MLSNILIEWSDATNLPLSDELDPVIFEEFLLQLSTNKTLQYHDILTWLLSLKIKNNQKKVMAVFFESQTQIELNQSDEATENWVVANITLTLECTETYPILIPFDTEPQNSDQFIAMMLLKHGVIDFDITNSSAVKKSHDKERLKADQVLQNAILMNTHYGAPKSSTLLLHAHFRMTKFLGLPNEGTPGGMTNWIYALQQASKHEDAFLFYPKTASQFSKIEKLTPMDQFQYGFFWLNWASALIDMQLFEEVDTVLDLCESAWDTLPQEHFSKLGIQIARLFNFRGLVQVVNGQADKAFPFFNDAHEILADLFKSNTALSAHDYFLGIHLKASVYTASGEWDESHIIIKEALSLFEQPALKYRLDLQLIRARLISMEANYWQKNGTNNDACRCLMKAERLYQSIPLNDTSDLDLERGMLLANIGTILIKEEKYLEAVKKINTALELLKEISNKENVTLATNYALILANKATALIRTNQLSEAKQILNTAQIYFREGVKAGYPPAIVGEGQLYITTSSYFIEQNENQLAARSIEKADLILNSPRLQMRRDLDVERFKLYNVGMQLIGKGLSDLWFKQASQYMSVMMEMKVEFTHDSEILHAIFLSFHYRWLIYSADKHLDSIPIILGAIHSRVLSRKILDHVELNSGLSLSPEIVKILQFRKALATNQNDVSNVYKESKIIFKDWLKNEVVESLGNEESPSPSKSPLLRKQYDEIQNELQEKLKQQRSGIKKYGNVRDKLSDKQPNAPTLSPYSQYDVERLRAYISDSQAIVCLLDLQLPDIAGSDQINKQIVWLLTSTTITPQCFSVHIDLDSLASCTHQNDSSLSRYRVRNGPVNTADRLTSKFTNWETMEKHIDSNLWQPIVKRLPSNINHLKVVSHGRFHLLPAELGLNNQLKITSYLSLLFLGNEQVFKNDASEKKYHIISCNQDDLPIAKKEGHPLLTKIWKNSEKVEIKTTQNLKYLVANGSVYCLHLAGHGKRIFDKHKHCHKNYLLIGKDNYVDDATIFSIIPNSKVVWLSACVLGISEHDKDGDPTGLVVPFLLKGSQTVIACLTPVPELWMPLLVSLTEWLHIAYEIDLQSALKKAKTIIRSNEIDKPKYHEFKLLYVTWLKETCLSWFQFLCKTDHGLPWEYANRTAINKFVNFILDDNLNSFDIHLGKKERFELSKISPVEQVDKIIDLIVEYALHPKKDVCDRLSYSVKLFTSHSKNSVSF